MKNRYSKLLLTFIVLGLCSAAVVVTAASQTAPAAGIYETFFPTVYSRYPPIPPAPVIGVQNPGGSPDYTVRWTPVPFADRYVLVEDNSPAFNTPVVVYQGPSNTWDAQDRAYGTHYYRVQAVNNTEQGSFFSPYSNTVSVTVNRFNVSKTDLNYGDCATLRWEFTGINAIFVSFTAGGDLMGVVGVDSRTICPSVSTTYRAFIERDNGTDSYEVSVSVAGGGPDACSGNNYTDPIILKFVPSRTSVGPGEFFSVSWEVACADEVYFTQQGFPEIGVTGMETREGIQISQDTEFKLRVHRNGFDFFRTFIVDYSG